MVTPNIDRLAARGLVFERSYCQQALCAPSRASMLTGLRPDSIGIHRLDDRVQDKRPGWITLPMHFKQNGYETVSIGKIFHRHDDCAAAWSRDPFWIKASEEPGAKTSRLGRTGQTVHPEKIAPAGLAFEKSSAPDHAFKDSQFTDAAIRELRRLKAKRFFLCVGYTKPHLPFIVPEKYWNLYDRGKIPLPPNRFAPANGASHSLKSYKELRSYAGIPNEGPVSDETARSLIHGYYASVSFLDAQVGRLMQELEALRLKENTIVVMWGDNGWKLGEHGHWSKHTNFEEDTRVPLIIRVPGMRTAGMHTMALVESVDIYPALSDLCGLVSPAQPMEGTSFVPLVTTPGRAWKKAVFSQYPRGQSVVGYAMRTNRYRYVEWKDKNKKAVVERELYDHETDPGENVNVIHDPQYATVIGELAQAMKRGWPGARP